MNSICLHYHNDQNILFNFTYFQVEFTYKAYICFGNLNNTFSSDSIDDPVNIGACGTILVVWQEVGSIERWNFAGVLVTKIWNYGWH